MASETESTTRSFSPQVKKRIASRVAISETYEAIESVIAPDGAA